ncbi:hypothetical protein FRC08_008981 [Ceratobasidium sp. 394]|nr:hypothetical protein FRC08_008981 [Ceratobasidium sp. 394]
MLCVDGGLHNVYPILAAYIADYPEQCLATSVQDNWCPDFWVPAEEWGDYDQEYRFWEKQTTLQALEENQDGYPWSVKVLGICPSRLFWADLPYVDISTCITPDILHQLNKGVFGDHIVKWCQSILGKGEVDHRIKGMLRLSGLHHFTQGISVIKQCMGKEQKGLAKVFLPTLVGCSKPEAIATTRNILDFMYYAHMPELSEVDLEEMDGYLEGFHNLKHVFVGTEAKRETMKALLDGEEFFHGIPKLHMICHYMRFIRELGTPNGYNTKVLERLHIDNIKVPWHVSNHVKVTEQMVIYLHQFVDAERAERKDAEEQHEDREDRGDDEDKGDGEDGNSEDKLWYPNPTLSIAKPPSMLKKPAAYLINKHGACNLIPATT